MGNAFVEVLEEVAIEMGYVTEWEAKAKAKGLAEGEEKKAAEIAKNMLKKGFSIEQTAELSGMDILKVKALSEE
ncbi:MAG: hypothetical protein LBI14_07185 [Treponema sp.]|nr:hypothetical protein [Treponema sp.]